MISTYTQYMDQWYQAFLVSSLSTTIISSIALVYVGRREDNRALYVIALGWFIHGTQALLGVLFSGLLGPEGILVLIQKLLQVLGMAIVLQGVVLAGRRSNNVLWAVIILMVVLASSTLAFLFKFQGMHTQSLHPLYTVMALFLVLAAITIGRMNIRSVLVKVTLVLAFLILAVLKAQHCIVAVNQVMGFWPAVTTTSMMTICGFGLVIIFYEESRSKEEFQHQLVNRMASASPVAIVLATEEGQFVYANPVAQNLQQQFSPRVFSPEKGLDFTKLGDAEGHPVQAADSPIHKVFSTGLAITGPRFTIPARDGSNLSMIINASPLCNDEGRVERVVLVAEDITAQIAQEQALVLALKEKDDLFREVHHRVRNNLMVILSLLDVHRRTSSGGQRRDLDALERQIFAISLIHQLLHQSLDMDVVGVGEYLANLLVYLEKQSQGTIKIRLQKPEQEFFLAVNQLKDLGLVVNELVSSIYDAMEEGHASLTINPLVRVDVAVRIDGSVMELEVRDDGPPIHVRLEGKMNDSSGFGLVDILCKGLRAMVYRNVEEENHFSLVIPLGGWEGEGH